MSYAVLQDLIDRFGATELTQLAPNTGGTAPDATVTGTALSDAANMIDGYLAARYQLPLNPVPPIVVRWNCDIARFLLWRNDPSDAVTTLYKAAVNGLVAAQAGQIVLEVNAVDTPLNTDSIVLQGDARKFGGDTGSGSKFGGF